MRPTGINLRIAFRSLSTHPLRTALTALGIVVGIAAVIATVAVGRGARQQVLDEFRSLGANLVLVLPGAEQDAGVRREAGRGRSLTERDALALEGTIPLISALGAFTTRDGRAIAGNRNWATRISGITQGYLAAREWPVAEGEAFDARHFAAGAKVVLLGRAVARELFGDADALGQQLRIGNTPFTVIGVLAAKGQGPTGSDQDDIVFVPLRTARIRIFGRPLSHPESVGGILIQAARADLIPQVSQEVRALLRRRHRIASGEPDDFRVLDLGQISQTRDVAMQQFTWLVGIVASISLLVGGIGIMNTMLVSVSERVREIGIHLALGAKPSDVRNQFLSEAVAIALAGSVFGIGLGILAAELIARLLDWPVVVALDSILGSVFVAAVLGTGFGLYPALKAAHLIPVDALQTD